MLAYAGYHHFKRIIFRSPKEAFITCFETQSAYKKTQEYAKCNLKRKFRFDCSEKEWLISQVKIMLLRATIVSLGYLWLDLRILFASNYIVKDEKKLLIDFYIKNLGANLFQI